MTVPLLAGIAPLADRYDGFILDLWGVLHDGKHPLPGAVDALERLHGAGKHIVILSNAPRRAEAVVRRIAEIGIRPGLYDALLSSGEATWQWLIGEGKSLGPRLYPIMAARDDNMLAGLSVELVGHVEEADFILNTGVESAADKVEDFEAALTAAAGRGLPMVCANPDLMVIHAGKAEICAGAVALRYEQLGGKVHYFGKPHAPIYTRCFELLGTSDRRRILGVGDSLRTDIAGAAAAGIDSLLVLNGIHQEELVGTDLKSIVARAGVRPTAAVPSFRW
jgi:HAD superfamily hydrolase (TIGR01459 family)